MSKKYYWIKLKKDFFDIPAIDWLIGQKNGCEYIVLYQKLCLLAANTGGELAAKIGEMLIPFDAEKIARDTKFDIDTVVVALELFKKLGLIYLQENDCLFLPAVGEMTGSESVWAKKKRNYKDRLKVDVAAEELPSKYPYKLGKCEVLSREQIRLPNGKIHFVDEKRYGGNGMITLAKYDGKCVDCGTDEKIVIHHDNGYSNAPEDLKILCATCHRNEHARKKSSSSPDDVLEEVREQFQQEIEIRDKRLDIRDIRDIDKEIDKDTLTPKLAERVSEIKELYNSICLSLPKVTVLNDSRKRAIKIILKKYTVEQIKEAFEKAEQSQFLSGKSGKWKASFDWLMKDSNLVKVLDGNYANKADNGSFFTDLAEDLQTTEIFKTEDD